MTRYPPLWEQSGSYSAAVDRRLIASIWPSQVSTGCGLTAQAGTMTVNIAPGSVVVPSQNNTGSTLCVSDAVEQVVIGAAPSPGQNRIDLIICRPRGTDLDGGANNDFIFDTVAGVPAASPAAPAVPAGTVLLGQVYVPGGSAAVTQGNITDARPGGMGAPQPGQYYGESEAATSVTFATTALYVVPGAAVTFTLPAQRRVRIATAARVQIASAAAQFALSSSYVPGAVATLTGSTQLGTSSSFLLQYAGAAGASTVRAEHTVVLPAGQYTAFTAVQRAQGGSTTDIGSYGYVAVYDAGPN